MPPDLDLVVTADTTNYIAELRLLDEHGSQLAYRQTNFKNISSSHQAGLFDLRNYVRHYIEAGNESTAVAEIGVCIAEEVLGKEIFDKLWPPLSQRTLRIQMPANTAEENHLAAAL